MFSNFFLLYLPAAPMEITITQVLLLSKILTEFVLVRKILSLNARQDWDSKKLKQIVLVNELTIPSKFINVCENKLAIVSLPTSLLCTNLPKLYLTKFLVTNYSIICYQACDNQPCEHKLHYVIFSLMNVVSFFCKFQSNPH